MKAQLVHHLGERFDFGLSDQPMFSYVYNEPTAAVESAKPFFHPLRTLAGDVLTTYRPADYPWHRGLSFSFFDVSGHNFWGGWVSTNKHESPVPENHGRQRHRGWETVKYSDDQLQLVQRLLWQTAAGERLIDERRCISVPKIDEQAGWWMLDLEFTLKNIHTDALQFASPQTMGHKGGVGYGGLYWRGPWSFLGGMVLGSNRREGIEQMGLPSPWLAFIGRHDGSLRQSTLIIVDHTDNPRHPARWFVRNTGYPGMGPAFVYDQTYVLPRDFELTLSYRLIIANGAWNHQRIEQLLNDHPQPRKVTAG